jgi:hypothetical protein
MAPEQARGEAVDHRADLFSLGSVLYACCTGRAPFGGATALAVLSRVSEMEPPPARSHNPEVPAWLEAFIARLMAKEPAERFQSAAEAAALLEGYLAHLRQPATASAPELPRGAVRRFHQRRWPAALVSLTLLGLGIAVWLAAGGGGTDPRPGQADRAGAAREHLAFDFRAGIQNVPAFSLEGPDDADELVKTDAQGLRVTIPAGRADTRPVVLALQKPLRGDFEITLGYELIDVGTPVPHYGAGVLMRVWFESASPLSVILSRSRIPTGERFGAHKIVTGPDGKEQYLNSTHKNATGPRGRLRLVRNGPMLHYLIAEEGHDWTKIQSLEIGTDDVKSVTVSCQTMYTPIALDARLTDLVIDADQIPGAPEPPQVPAVAVEPAPAPRSTKWWLAPALCAVIFLPFAAAGWWLMVRQSRRAAKERVGAAVADRPDASPAAAPTRSFTCSGCGKQLKARAELSGKKVKCPQCGQALHVPGAD